MKKGFLIFTAALVLIISGCGNSANNGSDTANEAVPSMNHSEMEHDPVTKSMEPETKTQAAV